ncbi:MAG: O-antigen ligase family protein [Dehalococcoidia bacterium]|nr:O-antigen ligase family protein [Dehalococcoidia bacterium]
MTLNRYLPRSADILTLVQPFLLATVYFSIAWGYPPPWLSWSLLIASVVPAFVIHGFTRLRTPFDVPIAVLLIGLSVSFAFTPYRETGIVTYQTYLLCILTYYGIVVNGLRLTWYWKLVVSVIGILVLTVVIATFAQDSPGTRVLFYNEWLYRAASRLPINAHYHISINAAGTALGSTAPGLIAYAIFSKDHRSRVISLSLGIFGVLLTILASSSSGLIAMLTGLAFVLCLLRPWTLFVLAPLAIAWLSLTVLIDTSNIPVWASWLLPHTSLLERVHLWKDSFLLIAERPLTGLGPGTWLLIYNRHHPELFAINPHNDLLTILSDAGPLGLMAIVAVSAMVMLLVKRSISYLGSDSGKNQWRALLLATAVSLTSLAANGLFETTLTATIPPVPLDEILHYHKFLAIPFGWALLALLTTARARLSAPVSKGNDL